MGRNEQLRESPLSRLGNPAQRPAPPPDDPVDAPSSTEWGIGSMPSWLGSQPIPDEMLPPDSSRGSTSRATRLDDDDFDADPQPDADDPDHPPPHHRVLPAPPAALALVVVGILAVVVAGVLLVRNAPADIGPIAFPSTAGPTTSAAPSKRAVGQPESSTQTKLVISVVGLVHRPGLVHLPGQARVADAITAAGGARPGADLLSLNLARPLHDGDQIIVGLSGDGNRAALRSAVIGVDGAGGPTTPGAAAPAPGSTSGVPSSSGKVNLNTATVAELDALPGVGPVTAAAIIDWRSRNGRFASVDQLAEVDGIGPGRLAKLRDKVTV